VSVTSYFCRLIAAALVTMAVALPVRLMLDLLGAPLGDAKGFLFTLLWFALFSALVFQRRANR
jgi:hypothetical protein